MRKMKIGVQLYTVRGHLKTPESVPGVFKRLKEMGTEVVQISGMCDIDSKELGKISRDYELPICSTHDSVDRLKNDLPKLIEEHFDYDCLNMGISMMPSEYRKDRDGVMRFIELLNDLSVSLKEHGMTISYHNHHFEFTKFDDITILDLMINETEKDVLFIPDTFWIKVGGYEPVDYIKKLKGRINTLHLKDYMKLFGTPIFRAIGYGKLDFVEILEESENALVENAVIELDVSPNPFKSIKKSIEYINKIYI